jgi:hypothetical protein
MAQIYDPNQAGAFNKALQSGLSTANAAAQAGITDTKDFALGTNGNLGGLIPGADAAPATGQATFQSVDFAQTFSGQPAQGTQLAMNAQQVQEFRTTPGNQGIPFVQNPDGPPGDLIPRIDIGPPTTTPGAGGPLLPLPTEEIQPRPVTGLDLTATSPFAPFSQVQAVPRPTLAAEAAPSPTTFSATDPRVTAFGPPPIVSAVPDNIPRVEVNGVGQVPTTDTAFIQSPGELGRGISAPAPEPTIYSNVQAPGELGRGISAPAPEPTIYNVQAPGELGRGTAAPAPVDESAAETARLAAAGTQTVGDQGQFLDPMQRGANKEAAAIANANQQPAIQSTYKQPGDTEWRFRISLAEGADYLYKAPNNSNKSGGGGLGSTSSNGSADDGPGILAPLAGTNGVIFPYTPTVQMTYRAKYNSYELVHSNYRGAFYQNSSVDDISIRGTFTAQDTSEAAYMLAVIHFFRSVTKMFYGQDAQRGAPPPLVYLSGLGDNQFNNHPAVVTSFDYSLPADVDYIRANNFNNFGTDLLSRRPSYAAPPSNPLVGIATRLGLSGLFPGATAVKPSPQAITNSVTNTAKATYVPTKIEISLNLMPMQTRDQVSKQFSLAKFANGNLLRGGFW